jgi:DOPA 4,5-dioxygenase
LTQPIADPERITEYHAHVYYQPDTKEAAASLRREMEARFTARFGRWHDAPIGPHTRGMYQVAFAPAELPRLLPWLMLNRGGLDVLCTRKPATTSPTTPRTRSGLARSCRCGSRRSTDQLPGSDAQRGAHPGGPIS